MSQLRSGTVDKMAGILQNASGNPSYQPEVDKKWCLVSAEADSVPLLRGRFGGLSPPKKALIPPN